MTVTRALKELIEAHGIVAIVEEVSKIYEFRCDRIDTGALRRIILATTDIQAFAIRDHKETIA